MSWEPLSKYKYARVAEDHDTIACQQKDVVIRLSNETLAKAGWVVGDKIEVTRGAGEHEGLVRLSKSERGWKLYPPTAKGKGCSGLVLKMGKQIGGTTFPKLPDRQPATAIKCTMRDGGIEFRLPWMPARISDEPLGDTRPQRKSGLKGNCFAAHECDPGDGWTTRYDTPATHIEREAAS